MEAPKYYLEPYQVFIQKKLLLGKSKRKNYYCVNDFYWSLDEYHGTDDVIPHLLILSRKGYFLLKEIDETNFDENNPRDPLKYFKIDFEEEGMKKLERELNSYIDLFIDGDLISREEDEEYYSYDKSIAFLQKIIGKKAKLQGIKNLQVGKYGLINFKPEFDFKMGLISKDEYPIAIADRKDYWCRGPLAIGVLETLLAMEEKEDLEIIDLLPDSFIVTLKFGGSLPQPGGWDNDWVELAHKYSKDVSVRKKALENLLKKKIDEERNKPIAVTTQAKVSELGEEEQKEISEQTEIPKHPFSIDKKRGRFKYGNEEWGHKRGRGKILKELMRSPQYEKFDGEIQKEGHPVPISQLASVGEFITGEEEHKGFGDSQSRRTRPGDRQVRDAIDDIRDKLKKMILKVNKERRIKKTYAPAEIKTVDCSFMLIIRK